MNKRRTEELSEVAPLWGEMSPQGDRRGKRPLPAFRAPLPQRGRAWRDNAVCANPARFRRGFTLAEMLVAMVIASMASAVIIRSLTFSLEFYQARTQDTAAQLLCESVSLLVMEDLTKNAYDATVSNPRPYIQAEYAANFTINGVTLPKACYGFGNTDENSRTVKISVTPQGTAYSVTVSVKNNSGNEVARNTFPVTYTG